MTPPRVGPYSPVVRVAGLLVTSGQLGLQAGPDGSPPSLAPGGTVAELRQALSNLRDVLASEGADLSAVVKATVFLVDLSELAAVNEVWARTFGDHRPARSAVGVASLPLGARVEVEAWAVAPAEPA